MSIYSCLGFILVSGDGGECLCVCACVAGVPFCPYELQQINACQNQALRE